MWLQVNLTAINQAVGDHTASNTAFPVTVRTSLVTGPSTSGSPELFKVESNFSSTQRGFEFAKHVRVCAATSASAHLYLTMSANQS